MAPRAPHFLVLFCAQKSTDKTSRVNGHRVGSPGSGLFLGRARHFKNSVAPLIELAGKGKGAQALGLDLFFFFDTLGLALIFWLLIIGLQLSTKINLLRSF